MRKLSAERRAAILTALCEGNSIAATCRMLGVNKITVLRLLSDAGTFAKRYHNIHVRDLDTKRVQMDEIWAFVHSKNQNVLPKHYGKGFGDVWTWVAMDADSKLVINWHIGERNARSAMSFVIDLADRLTDRVQLTSDGNYTYREAVTRAFGVNVDFAQLVKEYAKEGDNRYVRYSPTICVGARKMVRIGNPDPKYINTSYVERQNLTMRMSMRRFTRLTNAFSKRHANHCHAIALHYFHYNFIRKHQTIKTTPAVMAGVTNKAWTMLDFVTLLEREEKVVGGRLTDYKPAISMKNRAD